MEDNRVEVDRMVIRIFSQVIHFAIFQSRPSSQELNALFDIQLCLYYLGNIVPANVDRCRRKIDKH